MLLSDNENRGIRYAVWHLSESLEELIRLIPNGETIYKEAENIFKSENRIKEWIAVRVLLYHLMGKNAKIAYKYNGAPYLKDCNKDISISHTTGYVCIALSETQRVGIDIERVANKVERVKDRFINECEPGDTLTKMLLIWSAKESMYKLLQIEGLDFKKDLRVKKLEASDYGEFFIQHEGIDYKISFQANEHFVLTIASTKQTR